MVFIHEEKCDTMKVYFLIFDKISNGIVDSILKADVFKKFLFNFAYDYKLRWEKLGYSTPLLDKIVFKKVKNIMGGRLQQIISAGAPLSDKTIEIIKTCVCSGLCQGYGLTETTSSATGIDGILGRVGPPLRGLELRLVNWEEGNYRVKDKPYPRGEVLIGGDVVAQGYFNLPDETKENFFLENNKRWFKTGDIGEVHDDGVLKIIDRKKDICKLQTGEYIAPGKIEAVLKTHFLIENICIHGDSKQKNCVALIVPDKEKLISYAAGKEITSEKFETLCRNSILVRNVLTDIRNYAKQEKLHKYEIPGAIKLIPESWTPETGLITSTFKLKRRNVYVFYKKEIEQMYESMST